MGLWIAYVLLAALAVGIVAFPLLKARKSAPAPEGAVAEGPVAAPVTRGFPTGRLLTIGGVLAVLAAAAGLYLGTSEKAVAPSAGSGAAMGAAAPAAGLPDVDTMIARLAKRLEASPNDPEGWRMLGWSYFATQRYPDAVQAYAKAVALKPGDPTFQSAYGEAQVKASGDRVTPSAEKALRAALAIDPKDARALVYMARLRAQNGDGKGALEDLFAQIKAAAPDAAIGVTIREAIRKVAADSGIDVSDRLPPEPTGPTPADVQAAQALPSQDQKAMIDGMVARLEARLAASPKDADGWIMLMRSRKQLGQDDLARKALSDGMAAFAGDAATQGRLNAAARELDVR